MFNSLRWCDLISEDVETQSCKDNTFSVVTLSRGMDLERGVAGEDFKEFL